MRPRPDNTLGRKSAISITLNTRDCMSLLDRGLNRMQYHPHKVFHQSDHRFSALSTPQFQQLETPTQYQPYHLKNGFYHISFEQRGILKRMSCSRITFLGPTHVLQCSFRSVNLQGLASDGRSKRQINRYVIIHINVKGAFSYRKRSHQYPQIDQMSGTHGVSQSQLSRYSLFIQTPVRYHQKTYGRLLRERIPQKCFVRRR